MSIDKTLENRGEMYGDFKTHAEITQDFKRVMKPYYDKLDDTQQEALEMIFHKIGRVLNGNPNYIDSWRDIVGYASLVVDGLSTKDGAVDIKTKKTIYTGGRWGGMKILTKKGTK